MILYKGNTLVEGKHFIYEGDTVTYQGKVYGSFYLFKNSADLDLVLDESDIGKLKLYEHSTVDEAEESDDLVSILVPYFEKGLSIIESGEDVVNKLITHFTDLKNCMDTLGLTYEFSTNEIEKSQLIEFIKHYLTEANYNVSSISIPELYSTVNSIIYNLYKLREDDLDGNME